MSCATPYLRRRLKLGDTGLDGVSNLDEYRYGLNPRLADSNGDGIPDAQEVANINAAMSVIVNFLLSN